MDVARSQQGAVETKVRAVSEYLEREFPFCTLDEAYDAARDTHMFRIEDDDGTVLHVAAVAIEFLEGQTAEGIAVFLDRHRILDALRRAGPFPVAVTTSGLQILKR
jgi:hypothetical protein